MSIFLKREEANRAGRIKKKKIDVTKLHHFLLQTEGSEMTNYRVKMIYSFYKSVITPSKKKISIKENSNMSIDIFRNNIGMILFCENHMREIFQREGCALEKSEKIG